VIAVVVPTIREDCIERWFREWTPTLTTDPNVEVLIVEDNPEPTFDWGEAVHLRHYSWRDIDADLGEDAWVIPRRTDCVRSYGYWKAYVMGADVIATMDDDCYPDGPWLDVHADALGSDVESSAWVSTVDGPKPRGVPYYNKSRKRPVVINHGLWSGVPDLDAVTQLTNPGNIRPREQVIPHGMYWPMCGMNLAWRREVTPAMYFLLMGRDWPYDRFGDIWCGVMAKRIADHLGSAVMSGRPLVRHERASNVWANLRKEAPGMEVNERFWQVVDSVVLTADNWHDCYVELAEKLPLEGDYWVKLKRAMRTWAGLFAAEGDA